MRLPAGRGGNMRAHGIKTLEEKAKETAATATHTHNRIDETAPQFSDAAGLGLSAGPTDSPFGL